MSSVGIYLFLKLFENDLKGSNLFAIAESIEFWEDNVLFEYFLVLVFTTLLGMYWVDPMGQIIVDTMIM